MRRAAGRGILRAVPERRLSPAEELLLERFRERLLAAVPPGAVRGIAVFGSRARGCSDEFSDTDVAVLLAPGGDVGAVQRAASDAAWTASDELDLHELGLSPVARPACGDSPLDRAIARDGVPVWGETP